MRILTISLALASGLHWGVAAEAENSIDFNRDVRPILNEHCTACHGGVKQAGGISFVYREKVLAEAKSGHRAVVPGDLEHSELIYRITTKDEDDRMPPVEEHPEGLNSHEIETLKRWVAQGAPWGQPWFLAKPVRPSMPSLQNRAWLRQGLDAFVLARLEQEQIKPAPDAAPDRWLRRVSLDLIGLPPTLEERKTFLEAWSRQPEMAMTEAVDRLLQSPRFGERWASVWLDQMRYADSRGLGQDGKRNIWKYRDWVIDAFNRDLPFDEFTVKQIAGDLLPNASLEDRIATAAQRNTQSSEEGGTDDEEFRVMAVMDRVSTTWQAWQGITFGCVQCHSHPYDPIQHEEYYRFAAFFNNTADCDLDEEWPVVRVPLDSADYDRASNLDREIEAMETSIWEREYQTWQRPEVWQPLRGLELASSTATQLAVDVKPDREEFHTVDTVSKNTDITVEAPWPDGLDRLTALRFTGLPLHPAQAVADSEWGFVLSHLDAELIVPEEPEPRPISFAHVACDEPHPFHDPLGSLREDSSRGFSAYSRIHYPREAAFILEEPMPVPAGARLRVRLKHRVMSLGAFPLVTRRGHLAVTGDTALPELLREDSWNSDRARLKNLRRERGSIDTTSLPVLAERPASLHRPTHVFVRGLFLTKDKEVKAGVPASFPPLPEGVEPNRLALARWLVSPENPLTARVAVNRFWSRLFGVGLVETEEDFGSSGDRPSHPELLDYLALKFQNELGWSVKKLLREMVLSHTYLQESKMRPELLERDPKNRLLARGPRHRLSAEILRDQALAIAGLLHQELHGPPVHPPIPEGVWKPFQGGDKWLTPAVGEEDRYRRSVYTYTKRSIPYPMFASFDAPSREFCWPRRMRSNTPIQALMTLNDETFAECSKGLARRMKYDTGGTWEEKLAAGYLMATSRDPSPDALAELKSLFKSMEQRYRDEPDLKSGMAGTPDGAAYTVVAGVLLNMDEVMMK